MLIILCYEVEVTTVAAVHNMSPMAGCVTIRRYTPTTCQLGCHSQGGAKIAF